MVDFVANGLRDVIAGLDAFGKRVYKRAAADGLTDTAFKIRKDEEAEVPKAFDGNVRFTERGFRVEKASFKKDPVEAQVFILPLQARYLTFQIAGGVRRIGDVATTGGGVLTPVGARLTKAGNLPAGPTRFLARSGQGTRRREFVGQPQGKRFVDAPFGIWKRMGPGGRRSIKLLAVFNEKARYTAGKFDFFGVAGDRFDKDFLKLFQTNLDDEIRKLKGWK